MKDWFNNHGYKLSYGVAGWCAFSTFDCLTKGNYLLAAINAALVYANIKLAE